MCQIEPGSLLTRIAHPNPRDASGGKPFPCDGFKDTPMSARTAEPLANTCLAELLREKNPLWRGDEGSVEAEQTGVLSDRKARPDLILHSPEGSPIIIEIEYLPASKVEEDAVGRLGEKSAKSGQEIEQVIALRLPDELGEAPQPQLKNAMRASRFSYCVHSSAEGWTAPVRWPESGWLEGDIDALVDLIENVSVSERLVAQSLDILETGVAVAANILQMQTASKPDVRRRIGEELCQEEGEQTSRMAMAIIANALTFQTAIAGKHDILEIDEMKDKLGKVSKTRVLDEWQRILMDINYWPIFEIARKILLPIPTATASQLLGQLHEVSSNLANSGVTRSHDLAGRMFQRLISDRKFLATFYTQPTSAALLAHLAVKMLDVKDWSSPLEVTSLRIADLACGTGTLLVAAYHAIIARHRRADGDDKAIHKTMMEESLIAADIMPAATHLTASMLSSVHPEVVFGKTQVYTLPFGEAQAESDRQSGREVSLGSLDLLIESSRRSLFGTGISGLAGAGMDSNTDLHLPPESLDLVIMNPPFTAPTNHAKTDVPVPSFGGFGTSKQSQREMSNILKKTRGGLDQPAGHGNAGLASNFLDLAHMKLRPRGVLALIMPLAIIRGEDWGASRDLLARCYREITVVTIAGEKASDKAFSADTSMGEAVIIARKREQPGTPEDVRFVTLRKRPASLAEAVETARQVSGSAQQRDRPIQKVTVGSVSQGGSILAPLDHGGCAGVLDLDIATVAMSLTKGDLRLPQSNEELAIGITQLGNLGERGPVDRDINGKKKNGDARGPFDLHKIPPGEVPTYPVLWAHNSSQERSLVLAPDRMGEIRPGMNQMAENIWESASRLHFNRDFQINSQCLAASWTADRSIGGRAWPSFKTSDPDQEKALLLWANSTLGLLLFWWHGSRQQSGRTLITVSSLPSMSALNVSALAKAQLKQADKVFDEFSCEEFLPANEAYRDEARQRLDRAVLIDLLKLPESILGPLDLLRRKWCAEPTVHGGKATKYVPD